MKPIKRLQYMMLATIVATASHKLPASKTIAKTSTAVEGTARTKNVEKFAPEQQAKVAELAKSRDAEIATQSGSINRLASRMSDAVFGQKVLRDQQTNQKITDQTMIDNLSLQPETQVKNTDGQALELSSITENGKDFTANKSQRNFTDTASNYARNLVSRSNKKLTKRVEQGKAKEYAEFAKPGDKIVETWSPDGKTLLESKILSPDGSYKIISNEGNAAGKITFARTADGKTTQNTYYPSGSIKTSIVTTPRTLNALHKNSMQTRAETTYHANGNPEKTITFKESLVRNPLRKSDVISVKEYNQDNPLAYELKDGIEQNANVLEKRTATTDSHSNTILTTQVPSSKGSEQFNTKQIITIDGNNNITSIKTFEKAQESSTNQASQTLTFNADGPVVKTVTDAKGKTTKTITVDADQMVIDAAYESINGNITKTKKKQVVVRLKPREKSDSRSTSVEDAQQNATNSTSRASSPSTSTGTPAELSVERTSTVNQDSSAASSASSSQRRQESGSSNLFMDGTFTAIPTGTFF